MAVEEEKGKVRFSGTIPNRPEAVRDLPAVGRDGDFVLGRSAGLGVLRLGISETFRPARPEDARCLGIEVGAGSP